MSDVLADHRAISALQSEDYKGGGARFRNGDTLLARITPSLENGKTAWVAGLPEGVVGHGSTEFIVLSGKEPATDPLFVYYLARSPFFRNYAIGHMTGTSGRQRVPSDAVGMYEFPLPPLDEQRAIAHVLGTLDDKIELNRRMNETLEGMARALFRSWFVDFEPVRAKIEGRWRPGESLPGLPTHLHPLFPDRLVPSELGDIPEGWEVGTLGELSAKPQYGYTQSAKAEPIGPKFLRITDVNKKPWVEWDAVPHCEITKDDFAKYRLHDGDVLIARMADPGHGCVVEGEHEAVFASYLIRFRPLQARYARFLQYWLRSDAYWDVVRGRGTGTTRASLNAKVLGQFPLLVAPDPILDAFGNQVDLIRDRVVANVEDSRNLSALRDALLPRLVSGEKRLPAAKVLPGREDGLQ